MPSAVALGVSAAAALAVVLRLRARQASPQSVPACAAGSKAGPGAKPKPKLERHESIGDLLDPFRNASEAEGVSIPKVCVLTVPCLRTMLPEHDAGYTNPYSGTKWGDRTGNIVIGDLLLRTDAPPDRIRAYVRAGAREVLYFDPAEVRPAIVSCGGLCPGINNVIKEIYMMLTQTYGVQEVLGVQGGYRGFAFDPVVLTDREVKYIHHAGGTMLGTSRGGFDCDAIMQFVSKHGINQLYIIGGDGTHAASQLIVKAAVEARLKLSVILLPKSIDNDLSNHLDRCFGVNTAVEAAQVAIRSAKVEAQSNFRGIGLVKLMGRHSGSLTAHATLCSGDVDVCLIPEVDIVLEGPDGLLQYLDRVIKRKGHAVIVVAEGAGEEILGMQAAVDAGGNRKLPEIVPFLKQQINAFFDASEEGPVAIKIIDPSYTVRSCPASSSDALMCLLLGQNAVHAAMAGLTGLTVGLSNNRVVYIPLSEIGHQKVCVNPKGRTYERILATTGQPDHSHMGLSALDNKMTTARTVV